MATYTSDEYKASLLALLQRDFSADGELVVKLDAAGIPTDTEADVVRAVPGRVYYNQAFHQIFYNDSVTITPESYADFVSQMDADLDYCSRKGYRTLFDYVFREGTDNEMIKLLTNSFAAIGITMRVGMYDNNGKQTALGDLDFTLPDGTFIRVWFGHRQRGPDYTSYLYINSSMYTDLDYVGLIAPVYTEAELV